MVKIHWVVWLVLGGIVTFMSTRLGDSFILFFYLGLIFLAFGVGKGLISFVTRKKVSKTEKRQVQGEVVTHPPVQHACPHCRNAVRLTDYFCSRCGARLR